MIICEAKRLSALEFAGVRVRLGLSSRPCRSSPGDKASDFTLLDQNGEAFTLSNSLEQRKVRHLVHFYAENTRS